MIKLTLLGRPATKKNSGRIVKCGNFPKLLPSKAYTQYEANCLKQITGAHKGKIKGKCWVKALYWLPDRRWWPDLLGVEQATGDILQKAGVIANDKDIISWDGSRIAGIDKDNPRTEVEIREVEG